MSSPTTRSALVRLFIASLVCVGALAAGASASSSGPRGVERIGAALEGVADRVPGGGGGGKGAGGGHSHGGGGHSHGGDPHGGGGHSHGKRDGSDCPPGAPRGKACVEGSDFHPFGDRVRDARPGRDDAASREADSSSHKGFDTAGHTTVEQTIVGGDPAEGFQELELGPGDERIVREDLASAEAGREERRVSLTYLAHLTDFQLADEESPARVEFLDAGANPPFPNVVSGAWRPQEAFVGQGADMAIRQLNRYADNSPHSSLGAAESAFAAKRALRRDAGAAAIGEVRMDAGLMTGDLADNQHYNETEWVVTLLEGGTLDPNSGVGDFSGCPVPPTGQTADPALYAGVQDKDDYPLGFAGDANAYYDPEDPGGAFSDWPVYTGLLDRAQQPFEAAGLRRDDGSLVPTYVSFGNHDGLVQGNQAASAPIEEIAIGCLKPLVPVADLGGGGGPPSLAGLAAAELMVVPPDPDRRFVDKVQFKQLHDTGAQADAHGFALVDPAEEAASGGAAGYYAFDLKPGLRLINIDTLCEGGVGGPAALGNIDDPQFQWLEGELEQSQDAGKLILIMGHHPVRSLSCPTPDESAPPCTGRTPTATTPTPAAIATPAIPPPSTTAEISAICSARSRTS